MGGNAGKYARIYHEKKEIKKFKSHYDLIGLKEADVGLLYEAFLEIDFDNSGTILLHELLSYVLSEETAFVKKVFSAFDTDQNKYLDFHEFVISIWNYCTLNPKNLGLKLLSDLTHSLSLPASYSFSLFDLDDSGALEKKEIHRMLLEIYGKHYEDSVHAKRSDSSLPLPPISSSLSSFACP
jgi:Ca2+-binding EF-hand superfamily protein